MVEQTPTPHAPAGVGGICHAENFFPTLIYFELEEKSPVWPIDGRRSSMPTCEALRHPPQLWAPVVSEVAGW
jgi:hypothetical protein